MKSLRIVRIGLDHGAKRAGFAILYLEGCRDPWIAAYRSKPLEVQDRAGRRAPKQGLCAAWLAYPVLSGKTHPFRDAVRRQSKRKQGGEDKYGNQNRLSVRKRLRMRTFLRGKQLGRGFLGGRLGRRLVQRQLVVETPSKDGEAEQQGRNDKRKAKRRGASLCREDLHRQACFSLSQRSRPALTCVCRNP